MMDHGGKKARFTDSDSDSVQVKQEAWGQEPNEQKAMVPTGDDAALIPKVIVEVNKLLLDCPLCFSPLKPPVLQCGAKHAACGSCAARHSSNCQLCIDGDGVYEHIPWLDPYVLALKVACPNETHGCRIRVAYCLAADHGLECPHAPCHCPEPDCGFLGSPPALRDHLILRHDWLVTTITLGKAHPLEMQAAERRRLLAAEDGGEEHLFLLVASERAGERVVRVVCVRAGARAGPWRYWCKVWSIPPVDPENDGRNPVLMMEDWARSCAVLSEEAAIDMGGRYLTVPPMDMQPGGSFCLRVRMEKYLRRPNSSSPGAVAVLT